MRMALAQLEPGLHRRPPPLPVLKRMAANAAAQGCEWIVFPELADSGYVPESVVRLGGERETKCLRALTDLSRRYRLNVIAGCSEHTPDGIYNTSVAFNRYGEIVNRYRKIHLFDGPEFRESRIFQPGTRLDTVSIGQTTLGLSICFDLRFPEVFRGQALQGAQVLVNVAAWPHARIRDWETFCRARALENQVFMVGVNYAGSGSGGIFGGASCVIGPDGRCIAVASTDQPELRVVNLNLETVERIRKRLPVLSARRLPA